MSYTEQWVAAPASEYINTATRGYLRVWRKLDDSGRIIGERVPSWTIHPTKRAALESDEDVTTVMFRVDNDGIVFAIFPLEPGSGYLDCATYEHIGQHSSGDPQTMVWHSRPASPEEYAALKAELEAAPYEYKLRVVQRTPANATKIRWNKCREMTRR